MKNQRRLRLLRTQDRLIAENNQLKFEKEDLELQLGIFISIAGEAISENKKLKADKEALERQLDSTLQALVFAVLQVKHPQGFTF